MDVLRGVGRPLVSEMFKYLNMAQSVPQTGRLETEHLAEFLEGGQFDV